MKITILAVSMLFLLGCTTAGPFVTSISSDGKGGLIVEKSQVEFNGIMGTIGTTQATSSTIQLGG